MNAWWDSNGRIPSDLTAIPTLDLIILTIRMHQRVQADRRLSLHYKELAEELSTRQPAF
ncbi:hypothetical protein ACX80O_16130 [Arthrobacter sp. Hz1]